MSGQASEALRGWCRQGIRPGGSGPDRPARGADTDDDAGLPAASDRPQDRPALGVDRRIVPVPAYGRNRWSSGVSSTREHLPSPCSTAQGGACPRSGFRRERSRSSPSRCSGPGTASNRRCPRSSTHRDGPARRQLIAATRSNGIFPTPATRWSSCRRTPRSIAITTRPCSPTSPGPPPKLRRGPAA